MEKHILTISWEVEKHYLALFVKSVVISKNMLDVSIVEVRTPSEVHIVNINIE